MQKMPETITLDGKSYTLSPFMTTQGVMIFTELTMALGEPIIQLALQAKAGGLSDMIDRDLPPETISALMGGLAQRLTPAAVDSLFKRILSQTMVGNTSMPVVSDYDTRFMGSYMHLMKLVWRTVQYQFSDFADGLGGLLAAARAKKAQLNSLRGAAGPSGESGSLAKQA